MMNRLSRSLFPLLFAMLAIGPTALFGQPRPISDAPQASSEREALKLLNEALADAQALKLAENRMWAQSLAVAALWPHDERRARALLAALTDELKRLAAEPQNEGNRQQHFARGQLRQETAQILAPRDLALARSFLNATRPAADPLNEYGEPQLSTLPPARIAQSDARQLEQAALAGLAEGYGWGFWTVFERLRKVDREAAARVAARLAEKLRADALDKLVGQWQAREFAFRLLDADVKGVRASARPASAPATSPPLLGAAARRELLTRLADIALAAVPRLSSSNPQEQYAARGLLQGLYPHLPEVKAIAPALEGKLRAATAEMRRGLSASEREQLEINYLKRHGSLAELVEAARRSQTSARDSFYYAITTRLVAEGRDLQAVRQLITEQSADTQTRRQRLDRVASQALYELAEDGRFDEALKLIDAADAGEQGVEMLLGVARKMAESGDAQAALKLAERAESALAPPIRSPRQATAVATLMRVYARAAPARNFAWVEGLSEQVSELVRALATLGEVQDIWAHSHGSEGELLLCGNSLFRHPVAAYLKQLAPLARLDFGRARALADGFTQPEVRVIARLYAASGVLIEPELRDE